MYTMIRMNSDIELLLKIFGVVFWLSLIFLTSSRNRYFVGKLRADS